MTENIYEKNYTKKKTTVTSCLQEIGAVSKDLQLIHQYKQIQQDIQQLENEVFHLVVVGEFSRGKSTFINAMLGTNVLPMNITPTTAILSKITYGKHISFKLIYQDGHIESLQAEEFKNLKATPDIVDETEEEAVKNISLEQRINSIDHATVTYPLEFCKNNVEIIDTPGVNDISKARVDITYNYLKNADAAILVLAANQAVTSSEVTFLKEQIIDNQINNIFLAINYKDLVPENRWESIIQYVQKHIGERMPDKKIPPAFLLSSKQALTWRQKERGEELSRKILRKYLPASLEDTGFPEFEKTLRTFLFRQKGQAKLAKYVRRGSYYVEQLENRIRVQINDLQSSTADVEEKVRQMKPVFEETERQAERIRRDLEIALKNHETELLLQCNAGLEAMQAAAEKSVDTYNISMSRKKLMEIIQEAVNPVQKDFYKNIEELQRTKIQEEVDKAVAKANKVWRNVEICYSNSAALTIADTSLATIGDMELDKSEFCKTNEYVDSLSTGVAIGGLLAVVIAHPIAILGGVIFGFDTVFNAAKSLISALFGGFTDSPNEKARQAIRQKLRTTFAEKNDPIRKQITASYRSQCQNMTDSISQSLKGKVDDLRRQLQDTLDEKKQKEDLVMKKIDFLKKIDSLVKKDKQTLKEVVL